MVAAADVPDLRPKFRGSSQGQCSPTVIRERLKTSTQLGVRRVSGFLTKFLAGTLVILLIVGPMSYGVYGVKGFVVGCVASLTNWVLSVFYGGWEQLDKKLENQFGVYVVTSIFFGLLLGFGVGLGLQVGQGVSEGLDPTIVGVGAKWLTIGCAFGLSAGLLLRVTEYLSGNIVVEAPEMHKPDLPGKLGSFLSLLLPAARVAAFFVVFGVPFGIAEAVGGGLLPGTLTAVVVGLLVWFGIMFVMVVGINPAGLPQAFFYGAALGAFVGLVAGVFVGIGVGGGTGVTGFCRGEPGRSLRGGVRGSNRRLYGTAVETPA